MWAQYLPIPAKVTCCPNCRSPSQYLAVIQSLNLDDPNNARYKSSGSTTWCNIAVSDATRALGCEIPHWWTTNELTANETFDWLAQHGKDYGWNSCPPDVVSAQANQGHPGVAVWKDPKGGHGHIAMIVPNPTGKSGIWTAQAGARNFSSGLISQGFGNLVPTFYTHE